MRPPRTVKVGPHTYTIALDEQRSRDADTLGKVDLARLEIFLQPNQAPSSTRATVLHELLHAVLALQGVTCGDDPILSDEHEELLVHGLAPLLLDLLRRNPRLTGFLLAE